MSVTHFDTKGSGLLDTEIDANFRSVQWIRKAGTVASSNNIDLSLEQANYFVISGTTQINSLSDMTDDDTAFGQLVRLEFQGALTITHLNGGATGVDLPGDTAITTEAGDIITLINVSTGVWNCVEYLRRANAVANALTATRVPFVDANGSLTDDADMTFATDTLTVAKIDGASIGSVTPGAGVFTDATLGTGANTLTINSSTGITYTPAATWTFSDVQTVSGTWADLGIVTTVDINGGTITGVLEGSTAGTTINEFSIDGTLAGNSDDAVPTEKAVKTYADSVVAGLTKVTYHTVTNNTDLSISGTRTLPTVIGSLGSITIPAAGRITIFPDQIRIEQAANGNTCVIGLQIGSTEYYVQYSNNGTIFYGPQFTSIGSSETDIFTGTLGSDSGGLTGLGSLSIVGSGIPTGSQTVNVVIYNSEGNTLTDIEGHLLETTITVIVESFV